MRRSALISRSLRSVRTFRNRGGLGAGAALRQALLLQPRSGPQSAMRRHVVGSRLSVAIPPSKRTSVLWRPFAHRSRHHVRVSRRLIAWLVTLPLAVAGTQVAHAVAYRLAAPIDSEPAHDLSATGHGYVAYLPLALAIGAVLVAFALVAEVRRIAATSQGGTFRPRAWHFAVFRACAFYLPGAFRATHPRRRVPGECGARSAVHCRPATAASVRSGRVCARAVASTRGALVREVSSRSGGNGFGPPRSGGPLPSSLLHVVRALALGYGSRGPPLASR